MLDLTLLRQVLQFLPFNSPFSSSSFLSPSKSMTQKKITFMSMEIILSLEQYGQLYLNFSLYKKGAKRQSPKSKKK
jgi:hypothetical protein